MASHRFKVGQSLFYEPGRAALNGGSRPCKVVRLLPAQEDGQLQYRIRCNAETTERVVKELFLSAGA
jgi:hypothetical protein